MGYRGRLELQHRKRALRAEGRTHVDIATELRVAKLSVSLWVRDVAFEPAARRRPVARRPHPQHLVKLAEIAECDRLGAQRIGTLSEDAFLAAGAALYAGEGSKTDGKVTFANTEPAMISFFCAWLRRFVDVDEARLRVRVYLHEGLDLDAAQAFWSNVTGVPLNQFNRPYRARADAAIRVAKHEHGCAYVDYCCARTHRKVMGLVRALLISSAIPG